MRTTVTEKFDHLGRLVERVTTTEQEAAPYMVPTIGPGNWSSPNYVPWEITWTDKTISIGEVSSTIHTMISAQHCPVD